MLDYIDRLRGLREERELKQEDIAKLQCNGRYRHAKVAMKDGKLQSTEDPMINREGFDMTIIREDDIYTHSVYELVRPKNACKC